VAVLNDLVTAAIRGDDVVMLRRAGRLTQLLQEQMGHPLQAKLDLAVLNLHHYSTFLKVLPEETADLICHLDELEDAPAQDAAGRPVDKLQEMSPHAAVLAEQIRFAERRLVSVKAALRVARAVPCQRPGCAWKGVKEESSGMCNSSTSHTGHVSSKTYLGSGDSRAVTYSWSCCDAQSNLNYDDAWGERRKYEEQTRQKHCWFNCHLV